MAPDPFADLRRPGMPAPESDGPAAPHASGIAPVAHPQGGAAIAAGTGTLTVGPFVFGERRRFWVKTALLAITTAGLVPILLMKDEGWASLYLWFLVVVHVAGVFILLAGTKLHQIAPNRRGLLIRLAAILVLVALLYLVSKGLREGSPAEWTFWGTLFAIWALHTAGLAVLHLKGRREQAACPFA